MSKVYKRGYWISWNREGEGWIDPKKIVMHVQDSDGVYKARVSCTGSIDLHVHHSDYDEGYIHICSVDEMIARLKELRQLAIGNLCEFQP